MPTTRAQAHKPGGAPPPDSTASQSAPRRKPAAASSKSIPDTANNTSKKGPKKRGATDEAAEDTSLPSAKTKSRKKDVEPIAEAGAVEKQPEDSADKKMTTSPTHSPPSVEEKIDAIPPRSTADELGLATPLQPDARTLFALLLAANLAAARIGHDIAYRTARRVIQEGWDDVGKLRDSTWERRAKVLTEGGYTRYREKTATFFGMMAALIADKYDGDLNDLSEAVREDPRKVRFLLKEIKGVGDVCVDIFMRDAQVVWPYLAPFADKKALQLAREQALGNTAAELFEAVGRDREKLANLCTSLILANLKKA